MEKVKKKQEKIYVELFYQLFLRAFKQKRPFRRNGLTSNDCLPYEILRIIFFVLVISFLCSAFASNL
jgi:hypothetical protein